MACVVLLATNLTQNVMVLHTSTDQMEPVAEWTALHGWAKYRNPNQGRYLIRVNIDFWFPRRAA